MIMIQEGLDNSITFGELISALKYQITSPDGFDINAFLSKKISGVSAHSKPAYPAPWVVVQAEGSLA